MYYDYSKAKREILKCIRYINNKRMQKDEIQIKARKKDIMGILKMYQFIQKTKYKRIIELGKLGKLGKSLNKTFMTKNTKVDSPEKIERGGFTFIKVFDKYGKPKYVKLTKKTYSMKEIEKIGSTRSKIRQNAMQKSYQTRRTNLKNKEKKEVDRDAQINKLYNNELGTYPNELKQLLSI